MQTEKHMKEAEEILSELEDSEGVSELKKDYLKQLQANIGNVMQGVKDKLISQKTVGNKLKQSILDQFKQGSKK